MLVLLNGAPGVGKSALAGLYAGDHPLALVIDIDDLRRHLGQWARTEASKRIARDLAVALARDHLRNGYDVIIPQYLGKRDFVERLRLVAEEAGVRFVEVVLTDDSDAIIERFGRRRAEFLALGVRHPESDLSEDAVAAELRTANRGLAGDAVARGLAVIEVGGVVDAAYRALCEVIAER